MRITFAAVLAGLVAVGCQGRARRTDSGGRASTEEPRRGPRILMVDLSDGVPEVPPGGFLGLSQKGASFDGLVRAMEHIDGMHNVRGLLVRLGTSRIGMARAEELGVAFSEIGERLPVWCHADDLSNATLYLAMRGCKRIWVSPASGVDAVGLAAQTIYFHKLLADELGLDIDFLQVGRFKGAEEPFTRDGPSPEARASLESTLGDMRASWLDGMHHARPDVPAGAPEDGPYPARGAKELGLIDEVGYFDEARTALEKASGAVRAESLFDSRGSSGEGSDFSDLLSAIAGESIGSAPVALVRASGAISMDGGGAFGGGSGITERHLMRTLARIEKDDGIRAVVLRIDSPGGSALASDLLWHELMRIRDKKTLVVSVGDMAASGGYYLASTGSVIFADETSIVGSIGVVGGKIAADRALARIGVHSETIPAKAGDPKAAARAGVESLLEPWDDATRARVLESMTAIYELFLARVAEGRHIPVERVAASAEGRIFSGREGKTRGLVDELGGLSAAIVRARSLAQLAPDARVAVAGEATGILDALGEDDSEAPSAEASAAVAKLAHLSPDLLPFVASAMSAVSVVSAVGSEHAACALPFGLLVR